MYFVCSQTDESTPTVQRHNCTNMYDSIERNGRFFPQVTYTIDYVLLYRGETNHVQQNSHANLSADSGGLDFQNNNQ